MKTRELGQKQAPVTRLATSEWKGFGVESLLWRRLDVRSYVSGDTGAALLRRIAFASSRVSVRLGDASVRFWRWPLVMCRWGSQYPSRAMEACLSNRGVGPLMAFEHWWCGRTVHWKLDRWEVRPTLGRVGQTWRTGHLTVAPFVSGCFVVLFTFLNRIFCFALLFSLSCFCFALVLNNLLRICRKCKQFRICFEFAIITRSTHPTRSQYGFNPSWPRTWWKTSVLGSGWG